MDGGNLSDIFKDLTARRAEILDMVANGNTSKDISRKLNISPNTVDEHIDAIRRIANSLPRAKLAYHYRIWRDARQSDAVLADDECLKNTPEQIRGDAIRIDHEPIFKLDDEPSKGGTDYLLSDSMVFDQRAPWDNPNPWRLLEKSPQDLGVVMVILAICAGSILILMLAILGLSFIDGLTKLLSV